MCGITGIALNPNRTLPDMQERLRAMRDTMTHRGPDDAGLYLSPGGRVGLANRRLAMRDLTQAGHMPMRNAQRLQRFHDCDMIVLEKCKVTGGNQVHA